MASPFKSGQIKSLTGFLDRRRSQDQIGLNNFALILNSSMRGRGKRCRRGGWRRLLYGVNDQYNNEDLHDQLIGLQFYYEEHREHVIIPGGLWGYGYPYFFPRFSRPRMTIEEFMGNQCGYAPNFFDIYFYPPRPTGYGIGEEWGIGYPYEILDEGLEGCDSGYPHYYPASYFDLWYLWIQEAISIPGYPYGDPFPVYNDAVAYWRTYCGDERFYRGGCREAITLLHTVGDVEGRRHLIAGTKTRLYSLNPSTGNWRMIADGLGSTPNTDLDCVACSQERWMAANLDNTVVFVNGVNKVLAHNTNASPEGCRVWRAEEIEDLSKLNVRSAAAVGSWKGIVLLGDVRQDTFRYRNRVIWSDYNNPLSYIPDTDSIAGYQDLGTDETILRIEPLGESLYIFTDKSIYRAMLVETAGDATMMFEEVYRGNDALRYKYSLVNTGDAIFYWTNSRLVGITSFDKRPLEPEWMRAFSGIVFEGVEEDDLTCEPINIDRCDLFTGGWNPDTKEMWWSWATGENDCPDMSLVVNVTPREEGADIVDHGFTAFTHWDGGAQLTFADYLERLEICTREDLNSELVKEGMPPERDPVEFENPAPYFWNEENDWDVDPGEESVCVRMRELWIDMICQECKNLTRFAMADASDRTLKEYNDQFYAREQLEDHVYTLRGYDTVIQSGVEDFGVEEDKVTDLLTVSYIAKPQTTPNILEAHIAASSQPGCMRWQRISFYDENGELQNGRELRCLTDKEQQEHLDDHTREDLDAKYPTHVRGKYFAYRLKIEGTGGGSCFSRVEMKVARDRHH